MYRKALSIAPPNDSSDPPLSNTVGPQPEGTIGVSSHGATTSNAVPQNILTFRTIISMLALTQNAKNFEIQKSANDRLPSGDTRRQELKICSAFAALAVMGTEVVAVVTKSTVDALEVIVHAQFTENETSPTRQGSLPAVADKAPEVGNRFPTFNLFSFTLNPDWSAKDLPKKVSLNNVEDLCNWEGDASERENISDREILTYIEQARSKKETTLARHLVILPRLLTMRLEEGDGELDHTTRIFAYVASVCHPKMIRRFENPTVSKPYLKAFDAVVNCVYNTDNHIIRSASEQDREKEFLTNFILPTEGLLGIDIPAIVEQAELAAAGKPFQLYSEKTCMEFHKLVYNILEALYGSLEVLRTSKDNNDNVPVVEGENPPATFKQARVAAALNGYALLKLTEIPALLEHLKNIEATLSTNVSYYRADILSHTDQGQDQVQTEEKDEFKAVEPSVIKDGVSPRLSTLYVDWMKLLAIHFDAIQSLLTFVNGNYYSPTTPLLIKLLLVPPVEANRKRAGSTKPSQMLPWPELFGESSVFPLSDLTNRAMKEFLDETVATAGLIDEALQKWKRRKPTNYFAKIFTSNTRNILSDFSSLEKLSLEKLPAKIEREAKLEELLLESKTYSRTDPSEAECLHITKLLESLQKDIFFFIFLSRSQFQGALHCEALLASLICRRVEDPKAKEVSMMMQNFTPTFGVSKLCCPVCSKLLSLLNPGHIIKGSHNTVTACSLPEWLPPDIVDQMNIFFAKQLKTSIGLLMADPDQGRRRTLSASSRRLSQDSLVKTGAFAPTFTVKQYTEVTGIGRNNRIIR